MQDTQAKLDRALAKICNHEEEIKLTREEAEKVVKEAKEGENTRANILGIKFFILFEFLLFL